MVLLSIVEGRGFQDFSGDRPIASLIEFYLRVTKWDEEAWTLIYYTGKKRQLRLDNIDGLPPSVLVMNGRPNLEKVNKGIKRRTSNLLLFDY